MWQALVKRGQHTSWEHNHQSTAATGTARHWLLEAEPEQQNLRFSCFSSPWLFSSDSRLAVLYQHWVVTNTTLVPSLTQLSLKCSMYYRQRGGARRAHHQSQRQGEEDQEAAEYLLQPPDPAAGETLPENSVSCAAGAGGARSQLRNYTDSGGWSHSKLVHSIVSLLTFWIL